MIFYKNLFINEESDYFIEENTPVSMFTVYNSFTDLICNKDKDIMNKAEKTLLLKSILEFQLILNLIDFDISNLRKISNYLS